MIVVDASVAVTAVGAVGERSDRALRRISLEPALAPHVFDLEIVSAFRRMYRHGEISEAAARRGLRHLARVRIRRVDHTLLIARCWELRDYLTPYDASYVALAEQSGATLLTSDARLSRAPGIECDVELFDAST